AVVGHSQGEIAAACVAGALSVGDAARVVALRSQAIGRSLAGRGGMVSVPLPEAEAVELLARWGGRVELAAVNGPSSVVAAGDPAALEELLALGEELGVRTRRIPVDYASHTSHVEAIEGELLDILGPVRPSRPVVPFFSTVDGEWVDDARLDAGYWYRNLRRTVQFGAAVEALVADGFRVFVESSAHAVLTSAVSDAVEDVPAVVSGSLRRDDGGLRRFVSSVAGLWVRGVEVDWSAVLPDTGGRRPELPTYAFQHRRYWLDVVRSVADVGAAGLESVAHPLLGA
ncbi:acyltransferase domain-containing protein, partial [Streptomyces hokutonensis]|uniref:acyltransferase domain-containing protein n=1 Tax=Streptomyces hokutonensis TaxID=1306990 RepID=UPI0005B9664A